MYVIGADGAEAGQNLCKGSDNKILMLPANKYSYVIKFCFMYELRIRNLCFGEFGMDLVKYSNIYLYDLVQRERQYCL